MSDQTLTYEKIRDMMRTLPPGPSNDLLSPFRFRPLGRDIYEAPPPPPKIQVKDIKLSDGTSLLPAAFRAKMNAELMDRFGFQDDPFKDNIYLLGSYGIVCSPSNASLLRSLGP